MHVDDEFHLPLRVRCNDSLENSGPNRLMVFTGHDDVEAGRLNGIKKRAHRPPLRSRGHVCLTRAVSHLNDHGQPVDLGQRLAGKPHGGHPCRNENESLVECRIAHGFLFVYAALMEANGLRGGFVIQVAPVPQKT